MGYKSIIELLVLFGAIYSCSGLDEILPTDCNSTLISKGIFNLGFQLQNAMIEDSADNIPKNIVLSPTSLAGALAIVMAGSIDHTHSELAERLGFSTDIRTVSIYHQTFGKCLRDIQENNSTRTHIATSVFLQEDFPIRPQYRDFVRNVYKSDVQQVNFQIHRETSRAYINRWTETHTHGKITDILQSPLSTDTKLVVVSALYFNGDWNVPFNIKYTKKMKFKPDIRDRNKHIMVDMMVNSGKYLYGKSLVKQCEIIAIPYRDTVTKFYMIKPLHGSKSMFDLHKELDADTIDTIIKEAKNNVNVVVAIPKMNISSRNNLIPMLQRIGVRSLFSPSYANLGLLYNGAIQSPLSNDRQDIEDILRMIPNPGLFVNDIEHEVKIDINEKGTEAAAATATATTRSGITFRADEPFMFFIRDEITKLVTFSAIIFNPNE